MINRYKHCVIAVGRSLPLGAGAAFILLALFVWFTTVNRSLADTENQPQPRLPTVALSVDGTPIRVEIAARAEQRYMGLSFRKSLADDAGMLFVYPAERPLTFTMRNTLIPLSIAFISRDLVINEIHDMDVGPGQLFDSQSPAQYALEVNQGWFELHGIKAGAQIVMR